MRIQPKEKDRRGRVIYKESAYSRVDPELKAAIRYGSEKYGVSKSWIQRWAMCEFFGIPCPDPTAVLSEQKKRRRRARAN